MPYVIPRRTDIKEGTLQIFDLFFNKSQAQNTREPFPQAPLYVRPTDLNSVGSDAPVILNNGDARVFLRETHGLIAYLLVYVYDTDNNIALTIQQAKNVANEIINNIKDGNDLTDLDAIVQNVNADFDFTGETETLLRILAGDKYVIPQGYTIQDTNGDFQPTLGEAGSFNAPNDKKLIADDTYWQTSMASGVIYKLANTVTQYAGKIQYDSADNPIPMISVYDDDGSLLS